MIDLVPRPNEHRRTGQGAGRIYHAEIAMTETEGITDMSTGQRNKPRLPKGREQRDHKPERQKSGANGQKCQNTSHETGSCRP